MLDRLKSQVSGPDELLAELNKRLDDGYPRGPSALVMVRADLLARCRARIAAYAALDAPSDSIVARLNGTRDRWAKLIESQGWGDQFDGDIDNLRDAATALAVLLVQRAAIDDAIAASRGGKP